ncbi:MAG: hypothetical protein H6672_22345 [Anaerolineaceae bacterium]|nr:hypothetical protein [Anaerolineaceae bacterium]
MVSSKTTDILSRLVCPNARISGLEQRNRARLFLITMLFSMGAFILGFMFRRDPELPAVIAFSLGLYLLGRTRYYRAAVALTVFILAAPSLLILYIRGIEYSEYHLFLSLAWLSMPLLLATVAAPLRNAIFAVVMIILAASIIGIARGINPYYLVAPIAFLSIISGLAVLTTYIRSVYAQQIQLQVQQLQTHNQSLESIVQARTAELEATVQRLEAEIVTHKQTQEELAQSHDKVLQALSVRTQILANVSHDSRTPLNIITLRSEMLQRELYGPLNAKQRSVLDEILTHAEQLLQFINNLLQAAQSDTRDVSDKPEEFLLGAFLQDIESTYRILAREKGLHFQLIYHQMDQEQLKILIDKQHLRQIMQNLIGNAIKFTYTGEVQVEVDYHVEELTISVQDTGSGIPAKDQARIFEAFHQVDGSLTREQNRGVGLGLSIVKQLVESMHGEIHLQSEVGVGSTFHICLPLITAQPTMR